MSHYRNTFLWQSVLNQLIWGLSKETGYLNPMLFLALQLVLNPLMGHLSHVFPVGHLITSRNIAQRILKPRVPSLPLRKKLQQCVRILTGLRRHLVKEPTTLVLRAEFTNVQCVTSWLAKHYDMSGTS